MPPVQTQGLGARAGALEAKSRRGLLVLCAGLALRCRTRSVQHPRRVHRACRAPSGPLCRLLSVFLSSVLTSMPCTVLSRVVLPALSMPKTARHTLRSNLSRMYTYKLCSRLNIAAQCAC